MLTAVEPINSGASCNSLTTPYSNAGLVKTNRCHILASYLNRLNVKNGIGVWHPMRRDIS